MKRFTLLILSIFILVLLVGCGEEATDKDKEITPTVQVDEEPSATPTEEVEATPTEVPVDPTPTEPIPTEGVDEEQPSGNSGQLTLEVDKVYAVGTDIEAGEYVALPYDGYDEVAYVYLMYQGEFGTRIGGDEYILFEVQDGDTIMAEIWPVYLVKADNVNLIVDYSEPKTFDVGNVQKVGVTLEEGTYLAYTTEEGSVMYIFDDAYNRYLYWVDSKYYDEYSSYDAELVRYPEWTPNEKYLIEFKEGQYIETLGGFVLQKYE